MKKTHMTLAGLMLMASSLVPALAQSGPRVVQRSVVLNLESIDHYWPDPKKDPVFDKAAWMPHNDSLGFILEGPYSAGSELAMEFIKPDGKTWMKVKCFGPDGDLAADQFAEVSCNTLDEHLVSPLTGQFAFRILNGPSELFKGKFKVGTYAARDSKQPMHGIDQDWRVPLGFVGLDAASSPDTPNLMAYFWFKHRSIQPSDLTAQLFYQGKQVASNTDNSNSANEITSRVTRMVPKDPSKDFSYQQWKFNFEIVKGSIGENYSEEEASQWHNLARNPGDYEIRVMHAGKLVRTARFSVGSDGRIAAPGSVERDGDGNYRMLIPTQVSGNLDMPWNKSAYQTEMYYGNPDAKTSGILAP